MKPRTVNIVFIFNYKAWYIPYTHVYTSSIQYSICHWSHDVGFLFQLIDNINCRLEII